MNNVIYIHNIHPEEHNPRVLGRILKDMGYLVRDGRRKSVSRSRYFERLIKRFNAYVIDSHEGSYDSDTILELEIHDGNFFDGIKDDLFGSLSFNYIYVMDRRLNGFSIGGRSYRLKDGEYEKSRVVWSSSKNSDYAFCQYLRWMRLGSRYLGLEMHTNEEEIRKVRNVRRVATLMDLLSNLDI